MLKLMDHGLLQHRPIRTKFHTLCLKELTMIYY